MSAFVASTLPAEVVGGRCIAYGAGLFVVVYGVYAATSPDGKTWTLRSLGLATGEDWSGITFANGLFVAVSQATFSLSASQVAVTSPDGMTWTKRTMPSFTQWQDVAFGSGLFLAVSRTNGNAATSPDGVTWTARTLVNRSWGKVVFGSGRFVITVNGTSPSDELTHSTDGINFTFSGISGRYLPISGNWRGVFADSKFVLVSPGSANSLVSSDGLIWTIGSMPGSPTAAQWSCIEYGNGMYFAMSRNLFNNAAVPDGSVGTSIGGLTWDLILAPADQSFEDVAFGTGNFVGVSTNSSTTKAAVYIPSPPLFWRSFVSAQEFP